MSDLGLQLKQAREDKGLSLEDLQRTTKIQKRYLTAIEEGRFDSLPGLFYARAFVKTYAEAVGLDAAELLEQYKNELPQPSKEAENIPSRSERRKPIPDPPKRQPRAFSILPVVAAILFLIVIIVAVYIFQSNFSGSNDPVINDDEPSIDADFGEQPDSDDETTTDDDATGDEDGAADDDAADNEETGSNEEDEEQTSELTLNESSGNTSFLELDASEFQLTIDFTGACSVDIRNADGDFIVSPSTLNADDEIIEDLSEEESVLINLGASQNAIVTINGEEVDMPLDAVHQKLDITFNP
ncbi:helix-turn-helix domain-containing protein [Alkalicoccobacillus porphyridii]|uniref:Helix-turn-helix domain-containing protein n=1 Tax=Alkalicoccobacillus porphyridii TaxID=2597270 RepID=A0A553ZYF6_9BACI|nr:helix-turn-helix domain-containing protein [Alkalicoccobacillus porphyridii]TSB46469.1 helix-turn-helix domain-containing protein [Alkalicoccobacillus porphyridii]